MFVQNVIIIFVLVLVVVWIFFLDKEGRHEIGAHLEPEDKLKFKDSKRYKDRLADAQKATGEKDALVAMQGALNG